MLAIALKPLSRTVQSCRTFACYTKHLPSLIKGCERGALTKKCAKGSWLFSTPQLQVKVHLQKAFELSFTLPKRVQLWREAGNLSQMFWTQNVRQNMPCRTVKPGSCCNRQRLGALAEKSERGFPFHPSGGHISSCKASIQNSPASPSQSSRYKHKVQVQPVSDTSQLKQNKKSQVLMSGAQTMQTNTAMIQVKRNHVAQYEK